MSIGRVPGATGIQPSIVTAKGDLIVATASGSVTNQAVGSNNQVLTADSAQADGVKWANGSAATLTTTGDLLYASAANTPARLGIGSTDQVLKVSGGIPVWGAAPAASFSGVRLYKSGTQSIANNTVTAVTFDSEDFDTDGYHSTTTNTSRITIPAGKAGYYYFTTNIDWVSAASGARLNSAQKNGAGSDLFYQTAYGVASAMSYNNSFVVNLAVGDYVEMFCLQTSGSSLNINGNNYTKFATSMSAVYLGA